MKDTTGEKVLIEKFLYFARRLIPNYVLNRIMGDKVQYTSGRYSEIDTVKTCGRTSGSRDGRAPDKKPI